MADKPKITIHIFHRDLRIEDNEALTKAKEKSKETKSDLVTLFIFTPEQVSDKNPYASTNCIEFMIQSLIDLNEQLSNKLSCIYLQQLDALIEISKKYSIVAISEQRDYTPFAKKRELETVMFCAQNDIEYLIGEDVYLTVPGTVLNKSHRMFQKFTPFYNQASISTIKKPNSETIQSKNIHKLKISTSVSVDEMYKRLVPTQNPKLHVKGGRQEALKLLHDMPKDYSKEHDIPSIPTSNLSAHNHFGTVSIREVYHSLSNEEFRRQLFWRDFYGHIVDAFEELYDVSPYDFLKDPTDSKYKWSTDKTEFNKWVNGKTGHDLVDAAMIQLKETGYIHNRARLVAAVYLTKHLKIYWRWGEQHFAKHLVDYDFAQNFGNWCWVASVLPFSMAPFRSLNPEIQLDKFDKKREYVGRWLMKSS